MNEIGSFQVINKLFNREVALLWQRYKIPAIYYSKTKLRVHLFKLDEGSLYLPFLSTDRKPIIISKSNYEY